MKLSNKKVYKIIFNEYTNAMRDTVCYRKEEKGLGDYLHVYNEGSFTDGAILVTED